MHGGRRHGLSQGAGQELGPRARTGVERGHRRRHAPGRDVHRCGRRFPEAISHDTQPRKRTAIARGERPVVYHEGLGDAPAIVRASFARWEKETQSVRAIRAHAGSSTYRFWRWSPSRDISFSAEVLGTNRFPERPHFLERQMTESKKLYLLCKGDCVLWANMLWDCGTVTRSTSPLQTTKPR